MIDDAQFLPSAVIGVKVLAKGAHVHLENVNLDAGHVFHGQHGFFGGVHAAYRRAIGMFLVSRTNALQEGDALWLRAVGRTLDVPQGRPRGAEHPLELHGRDDVGIAPVAPLWRLARIVELVAGGQHHCTDFQRLFLLNVVVVDRIGLAGIDAGKALGAEATLQATGRLLRSEFGGIATFHLGELSAVRILAETLLQRQSRHGNAARALDFPPGLALGQFLLGKLDDGEFWLGWPRQIFLPLKIAVDRLGSAVSGRHRFNDKAGASDSVTGGKEPRPAGRHRTQVGINHLTSSYLDARVRWDKSETCCLADGKNDSVGRQHVLGSRNDIHIRPATGEETSKDDLDRAHPANTAIVRNDLEGGTRGQDFYAFSPGLLDLPGVARHLFEVLQAGELHLGRTQTNGNAGGVQGHTTPTNDDDSVSYFYRPAQADVAQQVDRDH